MILCLFFRALDLFWAVGSDQNLLLTLNPMVIDNRLRTEPEPPNSFNNLINQSTLHLFYPNKRSSASLFAAGVYKGTSCFKFYKLLSVCYF